MLNSLRVITAFFGLSVLLFALAANAAPKQLKLTYEVKKDGKLFANITETFNQDGKQYRIKSVAKGVGIYALFGERKLLSNGDISKEGLRPKHFESLQSQNESKALINDFDWKNRILKMQVKGENKQETLEKGTQDLLSVMYQFMFVPPKTSNIKVPVTIGKKLSVQEYKVNAQSAPIDTKAGKFNVVELLDTDGDKNIFLAVDQQYIPIKIIVRDDGTTIEQTLTKVKFE